MTIAIWWPVALALVSALVYAATSSAKVAELARLLYFAGVLASVYVLATAGAVHVLR